MWIFGLPCEPNPRSGRSPSVSSSSDGTSEEGVSGKRLKKEKAKRTRRMVAGACSDGWIRLVAPGEECGGPKESQDVSRRTGGVQGVCHAQRPRLDRHHHGRQAGRGVSQQALLRGLSVQSGRQAHSRFAPLPPEVRQAWPRAPFPRTWRALRGFRKLTQARVVWPIP